MPAELKSESSSVVIVGDFSPAVFHPAWFKINNLMAPAEADAAKVEVIHADATVITTEWLSFNVRRDKMVATCLRGESLPLFKDLMLGTLQLFSATPVTALGINNEFHYQMASVDEWHALGHRLAPKEPWAGLLKEPGMLTVQMQGKRDDEHLGAVNVVIQPSGKMRHGVFIQVNNHYNLAKENIPNLATAAISLLKSDWDGSGVRAVNIAQKILAL